MKKCLYLVAFCCVPLLGANMAFGGDPVPDCDCDGTSDADEITTCVDLCCAIPGIDCVNDAGKLAACTDACTNDTDPLLPSNCGNDCMSGWCCDQTDGTCRNPNDSIECTVDTCSKALKDEDPATHGIPVNTPSDNVCRQVADMAMCDVIAAACAKDGDCDMLCSVDEAVCDAENACKSMICSATFGNCNKDDDCPGWLSGETCDENICEGQKCVDPNVCDFYICKPGISGSSTSTGCNQQFLPLDTKCDHNSSEDPNCDLNDTCDGAGACVDNLVDDDTACKPDFACQQSQADCDPAAAGTGDAGDPAIACVSVCSNKISATCTDDDDCGLCSHTGASCAGDNDCGPVGDFCDAGTCDFGTCGVEACVSRECTDDTCQGGVCTNANNTDDCKADNNDCTDDVCSMGNCTHPNNTADCDDSDICTVDDVCAAGACTSTPRVCDPTAEPCDTTFCDQCHKLADPADGCVNDFENSSCGDIICRQVLTFDKGAKTISVVDGLPDHHDATPQCAGVFCGGADGVTLENSCYSWDIYCIDGSDGGTDGQPGLLCVTVDLDDVSGCGTVVEDTTGDGVAINVNSENFPNLQSGQVINFTNPINLDKVGGCTLEPGLGVNEWVLLANIEVQSGQEECCGCQTMNSNAQGSTLFGIDTKIFSVTDSDCYANVCWGWLYDANCDGFTGPGDVSLFASCWTLDSSAKDGACEDFDYNCNGTIDAGDFALFSSAFKKFSCAGSIFVDSCQLGCDAKGAMMQGDDGDLVEVDLPWATRGEIEAAGLAYPDRDWAGWMLAPDDAFFDAEIDRTQKVRERKQRTAGPQRGTR